MLEEPGFQKGYRSAAAISQPHASRAPIPHIGSLKNREPPIVGVTLPEEGNNVSMIACVAFETCINRILCVIPQQGLSSPQARSGALF
jgi:hypothetical protein